LILVSKVQVIEREDHSGQIVGKALKATLNDRDLSREVRIPCDKWLAEAHAAARVEL
jgi:hypothetical protein